MSVTFHLYKPVNAELTLSKNDLTSPQIKQTKRGWNYKIIPVDEVLYR